MPKLRISKSGDILPARLHLQVIAAVLQAVAETEGWDGEKRSITASADGAWLTTTAGHPIPSTKVQALANDHYRRFLEREKGK
jgi:hypothetical protein